MGKTFSSDEQSLLTARHSTVEPADLLKKCLELDELDSWDEIHLLAEEPQINFKDERVVRQTSYIAPNEPKAQNRKLMKARQHHETWHKRRFLEV